MRIQREKKPFLIKVNNNYECVECGYSKIVCIGIRMRYVLICMR